MTPEERFDRIERQLEFLANHQAQLAARQEASLRQIDEHTIQIEKHSAQIGQLVDVVSSLVKVFEEQGRRMEKESRRVDEKFDRLAESQRETNERLHSLMVVVERYFNNGRK